MKKETPRGHGLVEWRAIVHTVRTSLLDLLTSVSDARPNVLTRRIGAGVTRRMKEDLMLPLDDALSEHGAVRRDVYDAEKRDSRTVETDFFRSASIIPRIPALASTHRSQQMARPNRCNNSK